jgi:hypothetical protein
MFFQLITIDTDALLALASGNPFTVVGRLLAIGGWIPVAFVFVIGMLKVWREWRMTLYARKFDSMLLAIDVPKENEQLPKAVENIFSHISGAYSGMDFIEKWWMGKFNPTFSFELCSHGGYVQFYVRTQKRFRDLVESAVFSQYPEAEITEVEDYAAQFSSLRFPHPEYDIFGAEFILKEPSYLPLRTYPEFEEKLAGEFKDPVGNMLEALSKVRPEEQVWLQFLIQPTDNKWKKKGESFIKKAAGIKETQKETLAQKIIGAPFKLAGEVIVHGSIITPGEDNKKKDDASQFRMLMMTPDMKSTLDAVAIKISKTGFLAKIRYVYLAPKSVMNRARVNSTIKGSFAQYSANNLNGFGIYKRGLTKEDYFWEKWSVDGKKNRMLTRYRDRSNKGAPQFILNIEELATVYHFPIITVKAPLVRKTESRRGEPPVGLPMSTRLPGREDIIAPKPPIKRSASDTANQPPGSIPFV